MKITNAITVTELSRLTKKTRPSIYKYISEYEKNNYDAIPFSIKVLFDKITSQKTTKEEISKYCSEKFGTTDKNEKIDEIILLIKENYEALDLDQIKIMIKERIKKNDKE